MRRGELWVGVVGSEAGSETEQREGDEMQVKERVERKLEKSGQGQACEIPLTQGYATIVDAEDYEWLSKKHWHAMVRENGRVYAVRSQRAAEYESPKQRRVVFMHREIMGLWNQPKVSVDHIDHDGLNNRRSNLRICTQAQNNANMRKTRGSSQYKGVHWSRQNKRWHVALKADGTFRHLGCFRDEFFAACAYDRAAYDRWGDFANLNFPAEIRRTK